MGGVCSVTSVQKKRTHTTHLVLQRRDDLIPQGQVRRQAVICLLQHDCTGLCLLLVMALLVLPSQGEQRANKKMNSWYATHSTTNGQP
jgi:hypothetical protein